MPNTLGIFEFVWQITISADSQAASVISTETPRLIHPKSSGGEAWIRAAFMGIILDLNKWGIWERLMGVVNLLSRLIFSEYPEPR